MCRRRYRILRSRAAIASLFTTGLFSAPYGRTSYGKRMQCSFEPTMWEALAVITLSQYMNSNQLPPEDTP